MIAFVKGKVIERFANSVVVEAGGIGYEIQVTMADYEVATPDSELRFYTYHHVREQAEELFGFSSLAAKKLFEMLISVQGVGPKAALAILNLGDSEAVRNAIATSDSAYIQKAAGIGKKTAERVVLDLADKVGAPSSFGRKNDIETNQITETDEAVEALIALGYTLADAIAMLEKVDKTLPTAKQITLALKK